MWKRPKCQSFSNQHGTEGHCTKSLSLAWLLIYVFHRMCDCWWRGNITARLDWPLNLRGISQYIFKIKKKTGHLTQLIAMWDMYEVERKNGFPIDVQNQIKMLHINASFGINRPKTNGISCGFRGVPIKSKIICLLVNSEMEWKKSACTPGYMCNSWCTAVFYLIIKSHHLL